MPGLVTLKYVVLLQFFCTFYKVKQIDYSSIFDIHDKEITFKTGLDLI